MYSPHPAHVAIAFNEQINSRHLQGIEQLMTDDHVFIDTVDRTTSGREECVAAWSQFFTAYPDYRNVLDKVITTNDLVIATGRSVCSEQSLAGPAIWTSRINAGKVQEWRVFTDTPSLRQVLGIGQRDVADRALSRA